MTADGRAATELLDLKDWLARETTDALCTDMLEPIIPAGDVAEFVR